MQMVTQTVNKFGRLETFEPECTNAFIKCIVNTEKCSFLEQERRVICFYLSDDKVIRLKLQTLEVKGYYVQYIIEIYDEKGRNMYLP
jgi:hypothetical protein